MQNTAIVFPGQGSQTVGMLQAFEEAYPAFLDTFTKASFAIGYDVWALIQEGPEERLHQTQHTQVAMLTADVALFRLLQQEIHVEPRFMAGHSLGEYAALVCANAIPLEAAVKLVAKRGSLMQSTVPLGVGAMGAIVGLEEKEIEAICEMVSTEDAKVSPANYNAIGQIVVAGHAPAVDEAMALAATKGALLARRIPVSVPCHCELLIEAASLFAEELALAPFRIPTNAVVSNVDLSIYSSLEQIRSLLALQLYKPVRWVETIQLFAQKQVETILECGPGKVLTGLVKRIDKKLTAINISEPALLRSIQ